MPYPTYAIVPVLSKKSLCEAAFPPPHISYSALPNNIGLPPYNTASNGVASKQQELYLPIPTNHITINLSPPPYTAYQFLSTISTSSKSINTKKDRSTCLIDKIHAHILSIFHTITEFFIYPFLIEKRLMPLPSRRYHPVPVSYSDIRRFSLSDPPCKDDKCLQHSLHR